MKHITFLYFIFLFKSILSKCTKFRRGINDKYMKYSKAYHVEIYFNLSVIILREKINLDVSLTKK